MEALESYVRSGYNREASEKIAGVVFLSLRVPIPQPGSSFAPATNVRRSLIFPKEQRKVWYATSRDVVNEQYAKADF